MYKKLGFVGTGVMAGTILSKALTQLDLLNVSASDIIIYDLSEEKVAAFAKQGVCVAKDANEVLRSAETVLLGVKPQFYADILAQAPSIACKTLVSIMAGVSIATLRKFVGGDMGVTRVMPNLPCQVGKGMVALTFDKVSDDASEFIKKLFSACAKTLVLDESKFDAVTSVSGSGPAYVYMFAEGLIKGGMNGGLSFEESKTLALQTILGATEQLSLTDTDISVMVERVCSKGGTTIEAVDYYREQDLEGIIATGVDKCRVKSILLGKKL